MKLFFLIFYFALNGIVSGQSIFLRTCQASNEQDSALSKKNLHLIGEYHYFRGNDKITSSYHKLLNTQGIFPNYIIYEQGPSFSFLLNKYFTSGDDKIFNIIEYNPAVKPQYEEYRNYYLSLAAEKKFQFIGVDCEKYPYITHYALRYIIMENVEDFPFRNNLYDSTKWALVNMVINDFEMKPNPSVWGSKDLKEDIDFFCSLFTSEDSLQFKSFLKKDLAVALDIRAAYELSQKRKHLFYNRESIEFQAERERFMTNNIYKIFQEDSNAIVLGQFGLFHVVKEGSKRKGKVRNPIPMAQVLNSALNYPLTHGKVNTSIIYYQNVKPKHYKYINTDFTQITPLFDKMNDCELFLENVHSPQINSLILYKNKKVRK